MTDRDTLWFICTYFSGFIISFVMNMWICKELNKNRSEEKANIWSDILASSYMAALSWVSVMFSMHMMDDIENEKEKQARKSVQNSASKPQKKPKKYTYFLCNQQNHK